MIFPLASHAWSQQDEHQDLSRELREAEDEEEADEEDDIDEGEEFAEQLAEARGELKSMQQDLVELQHKRAEQPREAKTQETITLESRITHLSEAIELQGHRVGLLARLIAAHEAGEEDAAVELEEEAERFEWLLRLKRRAAEHAEKLPMLRQLQEQASRAGDTVLAKEATQIIGLHENALAMNESLRKMFAGEAEEIHEERVYFRLRFLNQFLDLRHEILDLSRELRSAREEGASDRVARLESRIKKLRVRAGLEDLEGPSQEGGELPRPLQLSAEDLASAAQLDFNSQVMPLLTSHCIDCHGPDTQEGELDLVAEVAIRPLVRRGEVWHKVVAHLKNRVMPPPDSYDMHDDQRRRLASYFEWAVKHYDYNQVDDPGYEATRRLTHTEYNNTIRDLFGIDLRPADKFPSELSGISGFDNSGNTLFLHRLLMERYFGAAEAVVERALPDQPETEAQRQSRAAVFVVDPRDDTAEFPAANEILGRFLLRAYRRPPSDEQLAAVRKQFRVARDAGNDFDEAIKRVIQMVLVSPKFLLRLEERQAVDGPYRVSDWDLASRLSYFLWSSMPDNELLAVAQRGQLHHESVLREQVDRMLSDPRSETLGSVFAAQWLGSHHLGVRIRPDPIDNPWCTDSLMESLKAETAMFFHSLIMQDEPISRLVDADYTFLNEETAAHYTIDGVRGTHMRRVSLSDPNRGGIFGQGSLLAITSFPGRTSPVVRGKWILSDVLGTPPPPPPPNVSEFSDEIQDNRFLSPRQKLQLHRRNPNCYGCHSQIDPLGFSLESFDWFGRWRTQRRGRPVDARGKLPNGTEFTGPAGLKQVIVQQRMPHLVRQLAQKMLSYALGRQLEYYDEPAVRRIIQTTQNDDFRFRALMYAIVDSYPFQFKKNAVQPRGT